jgi:NADPH:quinone reductase-like Zn-dependent oxidoreductase
LYFPLEITHHASAFGASVTGVCGPAKVELVRALGATEVINYRQEELTGEYDMVVDIAGARPFAQLLRLVKPGGTLTLVGTEEGGRWFGMGRAFGALVRKPFTRKRLRAPLSLVRPAALTRLSELLTDGEITPAVDRTFALCDVPAAITYLRDGHARGKIVVTP